MREMDLPFQNVVSPWREMWSWETLWSVRNQTQKSLAELFRAAAFPSEVLDRAKSEQLFGILELEIVVEEFLRAIRETFSVCVRNTFHYPVRLRDVTYPVELFYYRGDIGLLESRCVSIVGSRECTEAGKRRARRLARELSKNDYTIVSGLAAGIDTAAMTAAIETGGRTIGVIGTPITRVFPKENADLQESVATDHLLVSHVPFHRYAHDYWKNRRLYFPQRNETMAALSLATVIIEASETSGTHSQARACMQAGRKLFILNSCFERDGIKWPHLYEEQGAIRVRDIDDVLTALKDSKDVGSRLEVAEDGAA